MIEIKKFNMSDKPNQNISSQNSSTGQGKKLKNPSRHDFEKSDKKDLQYDNKLFEKINELDEKVKDIQKDIKELMHVDNSNLWIKIKNLIFNNEKIRNSQDITGQINKKLENLESHVEKIQKSIATLGKWLDTISLHYLSTEMKESNAFGIAESNFQLQKVDKAYDDFTYEIKNLVTNNLDNYKPQAKSGSTSSIDILSSIYPKMKNFSDYVDAIELSFAPRIEKDLEKIKKLYKELSDLLAENNCEFLFIEKGEIYEESRHNSFRPLMSDIEENTAIEKVIFPAIVMEPNGEIIVKAKVTLPNSF